ncbi:uncharacterized protein TNCV_4428291 [Trichonephila clavipes]|nr:uncharacterized protein TNCV_4428291 [Trichonephila clavipes]
MASHTITPAVGVMCRCKAKAVLRRSQHTNTIVITVGIESGFVAKDDLVPFRCNPVSSCVAPLQMEASMGGCQRQHTKWAPRSQMSFSQAPSYGSRRHRGPSEGATCAWMAADEAVGCTHFLRCGGLLDDWSVEGALSLVFV